MASGEDLRRDHAGCMVCGDRERNPDTLGLVFVDTGDGGVTARFRPTPRHQGYEGLLHGGMIATLLDAAMTHCLFEQGISALTAELVVRFVAPVGIGREVTVTARLLEKKRKVYGLTATMTDGESTLARATAKFIPRQKTAVSSGP